MLTAGSRLLTAAVMPRILQDAVMIELRVLGSLRLSAPDREDVASLTRQPRRAALLAYLAAATPRGSHRRDKLLALFWPELDQVRARAAECCSTTDSTSRTRTERPTMFFRTASGS
jgi:hypothetical protein